MGRLHVGISFVAAFAVTALAGGCNVSGAAPHGECTDGNGDFVGANLGCRDNAIATCQFDQTCNADTEECTTTRIYVQSTPCPAARSLCVDQQDVNGPRSVCQVASLDRTCTAKLALPDPFEVATIADLDHDGRSDLVGFGAGADGGVVVAMGVEDGSYRILPPQPAELIVPPRLGDFDGDGQLDLVTAVYHLPPGPVVPNGETYSLSLARGKGDGTFEAPRPLPQWADKAGPIAVVDVNGDTKDDLIGFDASTRSFVVLLGGATTMTALPPQRSLVTCELDDCPEDLQEYRAADFDKDGFGDLVYFEGTQMLVLFGSASGVLRRGPLVPVMPAKDLFGPVIPADIDGDGILDVVVEQQGSAWIHKGHGDGTFDPEFEVSAAPYGVLDSTSGNGNGLLVADLDGDGALDLVMDASPLDHVLVVRMGTGGGKFAAPTFYQPSVDGWTLLGTLAPPRSRGRDLLVAPFVIPAACRH